jgi:anaerobic carbon-monoxide dehydrogenase iron sulfur subunit
MKVLTADASKCTGYQCCETACAKAVFKSEDPALSCIRYQSTAKGAALVVCNQCGECINVCPTQAIFRNKAGTVMVRKADCVSCYMCVGFCPTSAMFQVAGRPEPIKCIACGNCIESCPNGVLALEQKDHSSLPA